jgi:hypothetical protein
MKTLISNPAKRWAFTASVVMFLVSILAVETGFIRSAAIRPTTTTPVSGAIVTITRGSGLGTIGAAYKTTTDANGNFAFAVPQEGPGSFTFTITPAKTFTKTGMAVTPAPFQVWANFNKCGGLFVGNLSATAGSIGPIGLMSNGSLGIRCDHGASFSGTLTK